jgi:tripartite-type tricarboxylate transporter receptor subunit TctC
MNRRVAATLIISAVAFILSCVQTVAQSYPTRPVRLIIAYAAGGTSDIIARTLADALRKNTGHTFIVENRPGGSGLIAAQAIKQAESDGYTLWIADTGHFAINPALLKDLPYDPLKDFVPITQLTRQSFYLVARKDFPADTVKDMVALSKQKSGGLNYGTTGRTSVHNLGFERIKMQSGANLLHIPYKGNAEIKPALLAGDIDLTVSTITGVRGEFEAGTIKALAFAGKNRDPLNPNVPTFTEAGLLGIEIDISVGVFAPAGTPSVVTDYLQKEMAKALKSPELLKRNETLAFELIGSNSAEFAAKIKTDIDVYRKVAKDADIKIE